MSHTSSTVVMLNGPRGSGKSLALCYFGLRDLCSGRKVWSNMPIHVDKHFVDEWIKFDSRAKYYVPYIGLHSEPLDYDALYSLSSDLTNGTVMIDEAQYFSDSRSSLSLKNRLLNAIVAQVRKRSLNLYYTVKVGDWVDKRLLYETDIGIDCFDLYHSAWGRQRNITAGRMIRLIYKDLSGAITGRPYAITGRPIKSQILTKGNWVWPCYDTKTVIDLEEAFTGVKLDLKQRTISNKMPAGDVYDGLFSLAQNIKDRQGSSIGTAEFWNIAKALGIEGTGQRLGRYLPELGIVRKQKSGGSYYYDLSGLKNNPLTKA